MEILGERKKKKRHGNGRFTLQDLAEDLVKPELKELVKRKRDGCKPLMIVGLKEVHIPGKDERTTKEEIQIRYLLEAIDITDVLSERKETKRIGRYSRDIRGKPVKITFKMEMGSQEVLMQAKKLANSEVFSRVSFRGDRSKEE